MTHTCEVTQPYVHGAFIIDTTHLNMTWLIYRWRDSFACSRTMYCVRHDLYAWLIHARWLAYSYVTYSYVIWLIYMWRDSFICDVTHLYVTWLIYMWRDSFMCNRTVYCMRHDLYTWLIHARRLSRTYIYMWRDSFICDVTHSCVIGPCIAWDMTYTLDSYMRGDSLVRTWLIHTWRDSFIYDVTHL